MRPGTAGHEILGKLMVIPNLDMVGSTQFAHNLSVFLSHNHNLTKVRISPKNYSEHGIVQMYNNYYDKWAIYQYDIKCNKRFVFVRSI